MRDPTGTDWTSDEIDLIVADYFGMLGDELAGRPYVKSHRNAALQERTRRSKGSIERKHQNISAVLDRLGLPWIVGYKPLANYQRALLDGIERRLDARGGALVLPERPAGLAESAPLFVEAPPAPARPNAPEPPALIRLAAKFDPAARDARNRALGREGEERVFHSERARLAGLGRDDLARRVRWVSAEDGDGAGYDILSFTPAGAERLLEVKTTAGHRTTPFWLSENERALSAERPPPNKHKRVPPVPPLRCRPHPARLRAGPAAGAVRAAPRRQLARLVRVRPRRLPPVTPDGGAERRRSGAYA